jgi:hypothetical protein
MTPEEFRTRYEVTPQEVSEYMTGYIDAVDHPDEEMFLFLGRFDLARICNEVGVDADGLAAIGLLGPTVDAVARATAIWTAKGWSSPAEDGHPGHAVANPGATPPTNVTEVGICGGPTRTECSNQSERLCPPLRATRRP